MSGISARSLRALRAVASVGLICTAYVLAAAPAAFAATGSPAVIGSAAGSKRDVSRTEAAEGDVANFSYDSWHSSYELDVDRDGRAVTRVTETLVARFPDFDQNRGIVRGLHIDYEGVSTNPRDFRVTDASGAAVPFEVESEDGFVAVLTGDDSYVHGVQTYVLEYTLSDTILARDDGRADEFYWDLLDFEHLQPVESFSAEITFAPALAEHLNGQARCYFGAAESTSECTISSSGGTITVPPLSAAPRQGLTVAIGLEPGSVAQPAQRLPNFALDWLPLVVGGAGLVAAGTGSIATARLVARRKHARGTVVAQYEVPAEMPPLIAASVVGASTNAVTAEIVHLAVGGALRIEDGIPTKALFGAKRAQPVIRVMDPARAADPLDQITMSTLFPELVPGAAISLPKNDEKFGRRMTALGTSGTAEAEKRGYFTRERSRTARRLGWIALGFSIATLTLVVFAFVLRSFTPMPLLAGIMSVFGFVLAIICLVPHRVHTPAGAEWREYLEGVRLFIRVAEQERLAMLQSYSGAERLENGGVDVIHVYEKLLPYAMLFGLEKEWVRVLEVAYAEHRVTAPYWYPGIAAHGIASLGSTISQFTGSLTSSVSYSSSSSGGSSGGGFAGGGGGGGFSGGR